MARLLRQRSTTRSSPKTPKCARGAVGAREGRPTLHDRTSRLLSNKARTSRGEEALTLLVPNRLLLLQTRICGGAAGPPPRVAVGECVLIPHTQERVRACVPLGSAALRDGRSWGHRSGSECPCRYHHPRRLLSRTTSSPCRAVGWVPAADGQAR